MESQPELVCILHVEDDNAAHSGGVVKEIDDKRWEKITEVVAARKKWQKTTSMMNLSMTFQKNIYLVMDTTAIVIRILLLCRKQ